MLVLIQLVLLAIQITSLIICIKTKQSTFEHWYGVSIWACVPMTALSFIK